MRDYLIISTIGKNSLHSHYCTEDREYDVMLIAYDRDAYDKFHGDGDILVYKQGNKFELIYHYLKDKKLKYKYYLLLDDDILITTEEANKFFRICEANQTKISHPAVIGYNHHELLKPHKDYVIRFTDWTELQAVCFSNQKLSELLWTFNESKWGWGFPELWWKESITPWGEDLKLFSIIDEVIVNHTRPYGASYSNSEAIKEWHSLVKKFDLPKHPQETLAKIYKGRYSVVIIFNEADQKHITECIDSIAPEAEIIVVKTVPHTIDECFESGYLWSIDSDLKNITRGLKHTYAEYHFRDDIGDGIINDFSDARNKAKSLATREWILSIDADERIVSAQHQLINETIETVTDDIGGFITGNVSNIPTVKDGNKMYRGITRQVRLFRNVQGIDWEGNAHETVELTLQSAGYKVKEIELTLFHIGYEVSQQSLFKKMQRNMQRMLKSPDRVKAQEAYIEVMARDFSIYQKLKETNNGTGSTVSGVELLHDTSDIRRRIRRSHIHL